MRPDQKTWNHVSMCILNGGGIRSPIDEQSTNGRLNYQLNGNFISKKESSYISLNTVIGMGLFWWGLHSVRCDFKLSQMGVHHLSTTALRLTLTEVSSIVCTQGFLQFPSLLAALEQRKVSCCTGSSGMVAVSLL